MKPLTKAALLMIFYQFLMGTTPIVYKNIDASVSVATLLAIRFFIVTLLVACLIVIIKPWQKLLTKLDFNQIKGLVILGLISSGLASWLYVVSIRHIGATLAALISNLEIAVGIILASILLKEKLSKHFLKLAAAPLFGLILILLKNNIQVGGVGNYWIGVGSALIVALLWGTSTVLGKIILNKQVEPIIIILFRYGLGTVFNLTLAIFAGNFWQTAINISSQDWLRIFYLIMGPSIIGFLAYYAAMKLTEVKKLTLFMPLTPVVAATLGLLAGEKLGWNQWLGGILIIGGVSKLIKAEDNI